MEDISNSLDKLTTKEKRNFYNSVIDNNLNLFISYLAGNKDRKPYNIFEEVSEPGYKWTVFHYAMHYGKWEIIKYIIEYLTNLNLFDKALKMKTNDNRCPFLCLLKSDNLNIIQKKEIYFKIINSFQIQISDEVINEANKRKIFDNNPQYNYYGDLKNELTTNEKMKFYNSAINGNLEEFRSYIYGTGTSGKPYSIFEEVSAPGYKWTVFHYSMHYGKWEIIKFIIEHLSSLNLLEKALEMKTKDNRCPILCLLKSNALIDQQKKELYFKIANSFHIPFSDEVINEANKRKFYHNNPDYNYGYLKNELTTNEKKKFYNSAINGNLEEFRSYIYGTGTSGKPYSIFEEVSAPGYKWTVFHYAMHYGKWEIIKFIIEHLISLNLLEKALEMKTKDNRCPILCLLKSNALTNEKKRLIFSDISEHFQIPINNEVAEELDKRNM